MKDKLINFVRNSNLMNRSKRDTQGYSKKNDPERDTDTSQNLCSFDLSQSSS